MKLLKISVMFVLLWLQIPVALSQFTMIGSEINYQGELLDDNVPANGDYEIQFDLCSTEDPNALGGGCFLSTTTVEVVVTKGLFFAPNLDFGNSFSNLQLWIQLSVRKLNSGDSFVALSPTQKIHAVPNASYSSASTFAYEADTLTSNGATNGQYLKYDGNDWVPASLSIPLSPWLHNGGSIYYSSGKIGIGTNSPGSRLEINSSAGEDSFSVATDNSDKFKIKANGDTKQSITSNGMLKYMLELTCNETANGGSTISKSYDGTITGTSVSVSDGDVGKPGTCEIVFIPSTFNVFDRYVVAAAKGSGSPALGAQCLAVSPTVLQCFRYISSTGLGASSGKITVLIY